MMVIGIANEFPNDVFNLQCLKKKNKTTEKTMKFFLSYYYSNFLFSMMNFFAHLKREKKENISIIQKIDKMR